MNYYNTFTTGTIDALMQNTKQDRYCLETDSTKDYTYYSKIYKKKVMRLNHQKTRNDLGVIVGTHQSIDEFLRTYLHKQAMEAVMDNFDYEHEYASPFDNKINQMLLLYKWISGIQSITQDIVTLTRDDLAKLDMDHKSIMDIKIAFDTFFPGDIVKSTYDSGTWTVKLGGSSLKVGEGPGYIKIKMQIPALEDKIKSYHKDLQMERDK